MTDAAKLAHLRAYLLGMAHWTPMQDLAAVNAGKVIPITQNRVREYKLMRDSIASRIVEQYYSLSAKETFTVLEGEDPELTFEWLKSHPDAVLLYSPSSS